MMRKKLGSRMEIINHDFHHHNRTNGQVHRPIYMY